MVLLRWSNANLDDPSDPNHYKWMDALQPYIKSEQLFICPSSTGAKYRFANTLPVGNTSREYGSYCMNDAYSQAGTPTPPMGNQLESIVSLVQVNNPAGTAWVADSISDNYNYACDMPFANNGAVPVPTGSPLQAGRIIERHLDTANFLFCDGHVKSQKLSQILKTNSAGIATALTVEDD
jgi:prepilin-type processing-associated H-X9-DG protein